MDVNIETSIEQGYLSLKPVGIAKMRDEYKRLQEMYFVEIIKSGLKWILLDVRCHKFPLYQLIYPA